MATPPTFSAGAVLTAAQMNSVGMWLVSETSLTTVTNNINNVFTSDYENYRIVMTGLNNASSNTRQIQLNMRTTTTDTTANYFYTQHYIFGAGNTTNTVSYVNQTASLLFNMANYTRAGSSCIIDLTGPNTTNITTYTGFAWTYQNDVAAFVYRAIGGCVDTATQYTGFSIAGQTDNLSGTVRVYGYNS